MILDTNTADSHGGLSAANVVERLYIIVSHTASPSVFGFDNLLFELVEPLARFEDFTYSLVAAYEDAACGVGGGVAHVNTDALEETVEVGAAEKHREPHLELRTPSDDYGVTAFWDGEGLQTLRLCG